MAPNRRQPLAMTDSQKPTTVRSLDRINLRLSPLMFDAIDEARSARPGNVSRNTWIAEAIEEKLAREVEVSRQSTERKRHA
jgi:hypothetical protein